MGERFTREILTAIESLPANPLIYPLRHRRLGVHWCFPRSFPCRIVYRFSEGVVTVIAVIAAARQDRLWRKRI